MKIIYNQSDPFSGIVTNIYKYFSTNLGTPIHTHKRPRFYCALPLSVFCNQTLKPPSASLSLRISFLCGFKDSKPWGKRKPYFHGVICQA